MNFQMLLVLVLLIFFFVSLLTKFIPFGLAGMICCVVFVLTGMYDIPTAFSGLSSANFIMVASMIVVATALGKTSFAAHLREILMKFQGKKGFLVLIPLFAILILLSQLMGQMACLSIMLLFVTTLDEKSEASPGRIFFVVCCLNCMWVSRLPIGMGGAFAGIVNALYTGLVDPSELLTYFDFMKAGIIPSILGTIYCLLFYRLVPNVSLDQGETGDDQHPVRKQEYSTKNDILTYAVFLAVTFGFIFQKQIGANITNIIPATGIIILLLFRVLNRKEVIDTLTSEMMFMIVGMQIISKALADSGVGDMIGQNILKILGGGNASPIFVCLVFCVVTAVMTNFLSNMGTMSVMIPIAATTALAGGMNPKTIVLIVAVTAWATAFVLPTGSSGAIMAFGAGNQNPMKTLKFTLPLFFLEIISIVVSINAFFPIYK